eukprot:scaffold103590_cov54-Attheya_sp.AAC.4
MAEDLNSCHRQGDACGCYSVIGVARLIFPRSRRWFPPFSSGVGSSVHGLYRLIVECRKCGGGGVACSPILALYAGGSSIPATDIFESMVAVRFDHTMLEDGCCFCMAMVVMEWRSAHRGVDSLLFFRSLAIAPI